MEHGSVFPGEGQVGNTHTLSPSTSTLAAELKCVFCRRCQRAVASLNTPLFRVDPNVSMEEKVKEMPIFDYQIYFQKPVSLPGNTGDKPRCPL